MTHRDKCLLMTFAWLLLPSLSMGETCNNRTDLCDRRYNEVTYATTHHSMSAQQHRFFPASQYQGLGQQLESGIRALMLELHAYKHSTYLCHIKCELGRTSAFDGLYELSEFMTAHPREVVTLFLDEHVDPQALKQVFQESGLLEHTHEQNKSEPWPTLQQLITSQKKLVVFSKLNHGDEYPWLHYFSDFGWSTNQEATTPESLNCAAPIQDHRNGLMMHFHALTKPFSMEILASQVNFNPYFIENVRACINQTHSIPNFIAVDFYSMGDVFQVVELLNSSR